MLDKVVVYQDTHLGRNQWSSVTTYANIWKIAEV